MIDFKNFFFQNFISHVLISLFTLDLFVCLFSWVFKFPQKLFSPISVIDVILEVPIRNHPQETAPDSFSPFWLFQKRKILNTSMNNTCAHCSKMLVQSVLDTVINKSLKAFFFILNKGYRKPQEGSSLVNITSCSPTCTLSSFGIAAVWLRVGTSLSAQEPHGLHRKWIGPSSNGVFNNPSSNATMCEHWALKGCEVGSFKGIISSHSILKGKKKAL